MAELPTGTVTFLFTDLADSSRLWEAFPDAMHDALARHDVIVQDAVAAHGGYLVKMRGDGAHAAFATADAAVSAAVAAQLGLSRESWSATEPLQARMGIHTGAAELRDGDYFGTEVNRAARVMAIAHGGQIVCSRATADLARAGLDADCSLVDLGEQHLRGLRDPEHVFQVGHADLRASFPPLRTVDAFPGNLPRPATEFVGREDEVAQIAALLPRSRLVTLTGTGGVGKTRLALQVAAVAVPEFRDGAWFVDLAALDDATFITSQIAAAMGLPEQRQGSREEALVGALARRHALVILDNCEHLVDAVAEVVDAVLAGCPSVTVIATTQESLGVDGEVTVPVRPMQESDAVHLFVERAAAARHGFALTADNASAIDALCRRLDGIPLAIELAAARVATMSPAAILERVDERFRLLGQGKRTARRRHQTLRAAVDWSYSLLTEDEQLVFARLAVFTGGFTLDAAEAVVADDAVDAYDVLDLVTSLVGKSMVQLDDRADADRYWLLETLRDYGLERLADRGDLAAVQDRHASWWLGFVETAATHYRQADDNLWHMRLGADLPNLRAALAHLRDCGRLDDFGRMSHLLGPFWFHDGRFREGLEWLTAALDVGLPEPSRERLESLALAGNLAINLDRYDEGLGLLDECFTAAAAMGVPPPPTALTWRGLVELVHGRSEAGVRFAREAIAAARSGDDRYELGYVLSASCVIVGLGADQQEGIALADEALAIARAFGTTTLLGSALGSAATLRAWSDPEGTIRLFDEMQAVTGSRGARGSGRVVRTFNALAHLRLRQYREAAADLRICLPRLQEMGELYQQSIALGVAAAALARTRPEVAVQILACIDRLRADGRFHGATGDLAAQQALRDRLATRLDPDRFAMAWEEGRMMTLDDAVTLAVDELEPIADPA